MILKNKSFWYLIFILFLAQSEISFADSKKTKIHNISTEDGFLDLLDQSKPTVIFASMDNCPHCAIVGPEFEKLTKNPKHSHVTFAKVNGPNLKIHNHVKRESNGKFTIPGYPVFIFTHKKKIHKVLIGGHKDKLELAIKDFLEKIKDFVEEIQ